MYKLLTYCLLLSCMMLQGCNKIQPINWSVTLDHKGKNPYGSYLAYESMKHFFPGVKVEALSQGFRYDNIDAKMTYDDGRSLLVLTGLSFNISDEELNKLFDFVRAGNELVLLSSSIDDKLERQLECYKPYYSLAEDSEEMPLNLNNDGKHNRKCISFAADTNTKYGHTGRTLQGYFQLDTTKEETTTITDETIEQPDGEKITIHTDDGDTIKYDELTGEENNEDVVSTDTEDYSEDTEEEGVTYGEPEILGVVKGQPQIVRYSIGTGHITLHAAPLVMSNYFLLQEKNLEYLQGFWNTFPDDITHVYWNSFYRHHAEHSDLGILWKHPATRWALTLAIIVLLLYVLLEMKRRQHVMAIMKPLENTSVTFVETVGRLYYNKGNHNNLAEKMVQHFLEWVRSYYYLNTNQLDEDFTRSLAAKSGLPVEVTNNLVEMIHEVKIGHTLVDEPYLYHLNNTIQRFYKNKNS
jgi:hypothetical protein